MLTHGGSVGIPHRSSLPLRVLPFEMCSTCTMLGWVARSQSQVTTRSARPNVSRKYEAIIESGKLGAARDKGAHEELDIYEEFQAAALRFVDPSAITLNTACSSKRPLATLHKSSAADPARRTPWVRSVI